MTGKIVPVYMHKGEHTPSFTMQINTAIEDCVYAAGKEVYCKTTTKSEFYDYINEAVRKWVEVQPGTMPIEVMNITILSKEEV